MYLSSSKLYYYTNLTEKQAIAELLNNLQSFIFDRGDYDNAEKIQEIVLKYCGPFGDKYTAMAGIYLKKGDLEKAKEYLAKGKEIDPRLYHTTIRCELDILTAERKYQEVLKKIDSIMIDFPDFNRGLYYYQARAYMSLRKWQKALESVNKLLDNEPRNIKGLQIRAELYFKRMKDNQKALIDLKKCLELGADDFVTYSLFAELYGILDSESINNLDYALDAKKYALKALALNPKLAYMYYLLSRIATEQSQFVQAKEYYQKAKELGFSDDEYETELKKLLDTHQDKNK
ncbi:MAG TPA: hypothetical protein VJC37_08620 [Planctomycetota bacterium]|nr:hypothetical protein [Planctomycetota bacterium]